MSYPKNDIELIAIFEQMCLTAHANILNQSYWIESNIVDSYFIGGHFAVLVDNKS